MISQSRAPRVLEAWAWLLLALALHSVHVYLSEAVASPAPGLWFFFSSDTVQYGLVYTDLFELGFHFSGWNISHAPEYVQMVWEIVLRSFTSSFVEGHVLEAMTQPVLLALALRFPLSRISQPGVTAIAPASVALVLTLIARGSGLDFIAFIWSNRHGFTVLLSALGVGFLIEALCRGRGFVGLFVAVLLGTASDLLFLVWFVGPALVAILLARQKVGDSATRKAITSVAAGVVFGALAFWAITPVATVGSKLDVELSLFWGALNRIADVAFKSSAAEFSLAVVTLAGLLVAAQATLRSVDLSVRILGAYVVALGLITVAAVAATAAPFREAGYTRYLLAPEFAGVIVLLIALSRTFARGSMVALLCILSAVILPGIRARSEGVPGVGKHYPPLVECLDRLARKHGLTYGIGDYWLAKYVTAMSRSDLRMVSVTPRLDPFLSFSNIEWFLGGVGAVRHDAPVYTFAILGSQRPGDQGISRVALDALGPPLSVESCLGYEVWILPQGANARIQERFRSNKRIREYYAARNLPLPVARE